MLVVGKRCWIEEDACDAGVVVKKDIRFGDVNWRGKRGMDADMPEIGAKRFSTGGGSGP